METPVTVRDRNVNLITNCRNIRCCTRQNLSKYFDIVVGVSSVHYGQGMFWPKFKIEMPTNAVAKVLLGVVLCYVVALALALAQLFMTTPCGWPTMPFRP